MVDNNHERPRDDLSQSEPRQGVKPAESWEELHRLPNVPKQDGRID
jgi:hypothetical protein